MADRALREAFRFDTTDLVANRAGRLSPRQSALLRAGRAGMRLSLAVFAGVMLASVGLVVFFNRRLDTPGGWSSGLGVAAGVAVTVIAIGYVLSRGHLATARSQQISVAQGPVEVLSHADDDCRVRIGATSLRLPSGSQLEAFLAGIEYRVYYLAGPVPIVLSVETVRGGDAAADGAPEDTRIGDQRALFRRGYLIVVLLGVLALGIPVAGALVGSLPPGLRPVAWIGLLAVSIGFVRLALSWLRPRNR